MGTTSKMEMKFFFLMKDSAAADSWECSVCVFNLVYAITFRELGFKIRHLWVKFPLAQASLTKSNFKHVYSKPHTFKHPTWKTCFSAGILLFFIHSQEMREHHASSCYCCLPNHCRCFSPICIFNCIIMERCQKWHFILKDFVYNSYRHT